MTTLKHAPSSPITIFQDNQSAIQFASDPVNHSKMKHIEAPYFYAKQMITVGNVRAKYLKTQDMTADIMTKALARPTFQKHLGVVFSAKPT